MGFWSNFKIGFSNLRNAVPHLIGKGIEKIGEVTGNFHIEMAGWKIQNIFPINPLEYEEATAKEVINLHQEAEKAKESACKQCGYALDEELSKQQMEIDKWRYELEAYFDFKEIPTADFILDKPETHESILNTASYAISQKLSGDNPDFVKCLKSGDADKQGFIDNLKKEVSEQLTRDVKIESLKTQRNVLMAMHSYCTTIICVTQKEAEYRDRLQKAACDIEEKSKLRISLIMQQAYLLCMQSLIWR